MDTNKRTAIITSAINMAGPVGEDRAAWNATVTENAIAVSLMLGETSAVNKAIDQIENCKIFPATVTNIVKHEASTRGVVTLKTKPSTHAPDGVETARTERTDNAAGQSMAKRVRALVGHRVLIWIELETMSNGNKVRIIRHVEDLGVDPEFADQATENAA